MDYLSIYKSIIDKARNRKYNNVLEAHYVFDEVNDFITRVELTPKEQFICFRLLFSYLLKKYDINDKRMLFSFNRISKNMKLPLFFDPNTSREYSIYSQGGPRGPIKSLKGLTYEQILGKERAYERKKNLIERSKIKNPIHNLGECLYHKTHEHRKKISEAHKKLNKQCSQEERERRSARGQLNIGDKNSNAKEFIFRSPDGKEYFVKGNQAEFCEQHGISLASFYKRGDGEICSLGKNAGWSRMKIDKYTYGKTTNTSPKT